MKQMMVKVLVYRYILMALVSGASIMAILIGAAGDIERYATASPSATQRFVDIPSEAALTDYCYRLGKVHGVTGVTYREFSPLTHTAIVTVFYNSEKTSVRQIQTFMSHTTSLWEELKST